MNHDCSRRADPARFAESGARAGPRGRWLFSSLNLSTRGPLLRDVLAGVTLAALSIPQSLGYARIAGMPIVTGLYTLLLPLVVFAMLGSSRFLVVAADSATAAVLAGGLAHQGVTAASPRWVALAGLVALVTAVYLLLARLCKLGFLADFLSQTVLVGFLTGVGIQVGVAVLGEMLGIQVDRSATISQLAQVARGLSQVHIPTVGISSLVVAVVILSRAWAPVVPVPLLAVVGSVVASAALDFSGRGIAVVGPLPGGLPRLAVPAMPGSDLLAVMPLAATCFVVIVAQSAATARAYAQRHHDLLDEDSDLLGLAAANAVAAISGTFVVNGSPTQTSMVERAGGRGQLAHLSTAGVVALVLMFLTGPLQYLPRCVLGAIVFTIAAGFIDLRGLRAIGRESRGEFCLAVATAAVVVLAGVGHGILLAMVLSLLWHVRHNYRPYAAVLIPDSAGRWLPSAPEPGTRSGPGLVVYFFGAELFYANAARFAEQVRAVCRPSEDPVRWLILDAGAITSVDFSAARMLHALHDELSGEGIQMLLAHVPASLRSDLQRHHLLKILGEDHLFDALHEALPALGTLTR